MGVLAALLALVIAGLAYRWTMGPVNRLAAEKPKPRMRFSIADILCLFVQIQLVLPLLLLIARDRFREEPASSYIVFSLLTVVIMYATWWDPVRTLNRAGISSLWSRVFMLVVAAPVCLAGSIFVGCTGLFSLVGVIALVGFALGGGASLPISLVDLLFTTLAALVALLALAGLRRGIRAVASASKSQDESPAP